MSLLRSAALLSALTVAALPERAAADSHLGDAWCGLRAEVTRTLTTIAGARLRAEGIRDPESLMQLWADDAGGWTLVVAYADGRSCIVAMGEAWEPASQAPS